MHIPAGNPTERITRRTMVRSLAASSFAICLPKAFAATPARKARIAITFDLEMSAQYPQRDMTEWNYQKGNLDQPTKDYAVAAAKIVRELGGRIHFFCVGRVLEQADVEWLKQLDAAGHPIGNHTYDHVYVLAKTAVETQFRFQRSPWLVSGRSAHDVIAENIRMTTEALNERCGITTNGFRTPGGFVTGLEGREDIQQVLLDQGFKWVSSKYPAYEMGTAGERPSAAVFDSIVAAQQHAQPFAYPTGLIEIPMNPISDVNAFRSLRWKLDDFLKAVRLGVDWAIETGGMYDFLCHPSCMVVEDPAFETVKMICERVRENQDQAEIVGLDTIASEFKA